MTAPGNYWKTLTGQAYKDVPAAHSGGIAFTGTGAVAD
jgi:hypothetical protein